VVRAVGGVGKTILSRTRSDPQNLLAHRVEHEFGGIVEIELLHQIEAVRFDETFLRRAYVDSRSACVLAAMLGLAHDLGLATLGSVDEANSNGEFAFDYVVIPAFD